MTLVRARMLLVGIFLFGLILQCICILIVYSKAAITSDDVTTLLVKVLEIYSVPLAVILGGIFARPANAVPTGASEVTPSTAFWVAVGLALVWNALLLWRGAAFSVAAFRPSIEDNVNLFASYLDAISRASLFLVAGALAYFFSKT
jgi:hypothetical protein